MPFPNVPSSTFTPAPGAERRFSVRFLQGIEPRLSLAGVDPGLVKELGHRFKHMDRTGLDREGRIVDRLLESANPVHGMALYGLMAQLGSIVAPNGSSVSANAEGSWTVRPFGGEPFELPAKAGQRAELGGGYSAITKDSNTIEVAGQSLNREISDRTTQRAGEFSIALGPAATLFATTYNPGPLVGVVGWYLSQSTSDSLTAFGDYFDRIGAHEAGQACHAGAKGAAISADLFGMLAAPATGSSLTSGVALMTLNAMPRAAHDGVMALLDKAGRSAAPSSRSDPLLEKAALLNFVAKNPMLFLQAEHTKSEQGMTALSNFAAKIRGAARDVILSAAS
ncbi:MAG: hypothetical protein JNM69_25095 [Archangium sp.]|nr:hypothetical protein [Archangium sp.]